MEDIQIGVENYLEGDFVPQLFSIPHKDHNELPFDKQIRWETFERLCVLIASEECDDARLYLRQGNKQHGIDVFCIKKDLINPANSLNKIFIQCKKVEKYSVSKFKMATKEFDNGQFAQIAKEFIMAIKVDLRSDKKLTSEFIKIRDSYHEKGVDFDVWDTDKLNQKLKRYPAIVAEIFGKEWAQHICDESLFSEWDKSQIIPPPKIQYKKLDHFIERKVKSENNLNENNNDFWRKEETIFLFDLIKENESQKIVLLGAAGTGKTAELNNIAHSFCNEQEIYYPIVCSLKDYSEQDFENYISAFEPLWMNIAERKRLIILDGFDEIPTNKIETAVGKLNLFSKKYKKSTVLLSMRSNFYNAQLDDYKCFYIEDFSEDAISRYLNSRMDKVKSKTFERIAKKNKIYQLFTNPFNLVEFTTLFLQIGESNFPKNRSEAFEKIIQKKIEENKKLHKVKNVSDLDYEITMRKTLERLSLSMVELGVNYLTKSDFRKIIVNPEQRELLKHSPLVYFNNHEKGGIKFIHNNYQEYLAATVLSYHLTGIIKKSIAFKPDYTIVKPKWLNTLTFLMGILGQRNETEFLELLNWLIEIKPEIIVRFEREIIPSHVRLKIIKSIFNFYGSRNMYLENASLSYKDIVEFSGNEKIFIEYLLNEFYSYQSEEHLENILSTLSLCLKFYSKEDEFEIVLINIIQSKEHTVYIQGKAIQCFFRIKDRGQKDIDRIINICPNTNTNEIRNELLMQLSKLNLCNENVDFILSTTAVRKDEYEKKKIRYVDYQQTIAIGKCTSKQAINKVLIFVLKHLEDIHKDPYENEIIDSTFIGNCIKAYEPGCGILEKIIEIHLFSCELHANKYQTLLIQFYNETSTTLDAFKIIQKTKNESFQKYSILGSIADLECIDYIIEQFKKGEIKDENIFYLRSNLNPGEIHDTFYNDINKISNGRFTYIHMPNYKIIREERYKKDLALLMNKEDFLSEVKAIFKLYDKTSLSYDDIRKLVTTFHESFISFKYGIVIDKLWKMSEKTKALNYDDFVETINDEIKWQLYVLSSILKFIENKSEIGDWHSKFIVDWCKQNIDDCDFKNAIWENTDRTIQFRNKENIVAFIWKRFEFSIQDVVMLDMLSFDFSGLSMRMNNDEYNVSLSDKILEKISDADLVKQRVINNLRLGNLVSYVCATHIGLCQKLQITESTPFILNSIRSMSLHDFDIIKATKIYIELDGDKEELKDYVLSLDCNETEYWWDLIELIYIDFKEYVDLHLLNCFKINMKEEDKLIAIKYLLPIGEVLAIEFLFKWIKTRMQYPNGLRLNYSLVKFSPSQVLHNTFELFKNSFSKKFIQKSIGYEYSRDILDLIWEYALSSQVNFNETKKHINEFLEKNKSKKKMIQVLNYWQLNLDREFYSKRAEIPTINEVIQEVDSLCT
ncbi:MAG: hypothetical protein JNL95_04820 [Chitinophagales bacterium]|nr:hypothetical protein [Chitinophagales bacterium]